MIASTAFPVWHWCIPVICGVSILWASLRLRGWVSSSVGDEAESALHSFFSSIFRTFVIKQCVFFGSILVGFSAFGAALVWLKFHHAISIVLLIWGLLAATTVAVTMATVVHHIGSRLKTQDMSMVPHIGKALMSMLISVAVLDIWAWLTIITESISRNWFRLGDAVAKHLTTGSLWTPDLVQSSAFQHVIQHQVTMTCLFLGLGVLIHALFIVFSSRVMMTSLDRTNDEIVAAYPGLGHYDLRNPIGIPSTLVELVSRSWTKTAVVQSVVMTAILGAIGIEAVTLSEGIEGLSPSSMSMGLLLVAIGAIATIVSTAVGRENPTLEFGFSWILVGITSVVMASMHQVSDRFFGVYGLSMVVALILFVLSYHESYFKRCIVGRLERFFVIYTLILTWIGTAFWIGGGHTHVLLGINGIGLATIVMLASSIPLMSAYFSQSLVSLRRQYRLLLGQEIDQDNSDSVFKNEVAMGVVAMGTSWVWLFLFMDWMPWVMTHVTKHAVVDRIIITVNHELDSSLTRQNWVETLRAIDFGEIDGLLGMTPSNPDFVMGIFVAILLGLMLGIVLLRFTRRAKSKLVQSSIAELNANDGILEGRTLPDYSVPLNTVSSIGLWSGIVVELLTLIGLVGIAIAMGWGGYAGACIGLVVMEGFLYTAHITEVKDDLKNELEMGAIVLSLMTRVSVVLICLISGSLLELGLGLMK